MNLRILILLFFIPSLLCHAQSQRSIEGTVLDAKTKEPLSWATIKIKEQMIESVANQHGTFGIMVSAEREADTLEVSHLGYKTVKKSVADIHEPINVLLEDYSVELRAVTVTSRKVSLRNVDQSLKKVKGNLYAYEGETTNGLYSLFLSFLNEEGKEELLKRCEYDLSSYDEETKSFYRIYTAPFTPPENKKDTSQTDFSNYPAVNISYEGAVLFCQWFTEQYNTNPGKKKFKKVKFRLPTLKEWQIIALGYAAFQSWELDENMLQVIVPTDSLTESAKGKKKIIPASDVKYPWWGHYYYRNSVLNAKHCYLGNFKSPPLANPCPAGPLPGNDGWTKMSPTCVYFPNKMGIYDVVGNVAEMVQEKGKACGGSWDDTPEESTIRSVKTYEKPNGTIGFRMVMDVLEE